MKPCYCVCSLVARNVFSVFVYMFLSLLMDLKCDVEHKREPVENQSSPLRCNQKWSYSLCQLSETNNQFATWPGHVLKENKQETWGTLDFWNSAPRLVWASKEENQSNHHIQMFCIMNMSSQSQVISWRILLHSLSLYDVMLTGFPHVFCCNFSGETVWVNWIDFLILSLISPFILWQKLNFDE